MLALFWAFSLSAAAQTVLPRAYSHNDYKQARPLFEALDRGFSGVEADVHLRGAELFIGHTGGEVQPDVTLRRLYLDPLLARVRANGGRVYPGGPKGFLLMVDFKSNGEQSYAALREMLKPYQEMLTVFTPDSIEERAVTIAISGHRPKEMLGAEPLRYAGIDGDLGDLDAPEKTLFPTISDSWGRTLQDSPSRDYDARRLARLVAQAHERGRKIRFYQLPNNESYWKIVYDARVDYINADKLDRLQEFLLKQP